MNKRHRRPRDEYRRTGETKRRGRQDHPLLRTGRTDSRASRSTGNYRRYDHRDVATLRFIHRARQLGFSLEDVGKLLGLWRDHRRSSVQVKQPGAGHVREIDRKLAELKTIRDTLSHLADHCHGDGRPDCPILTIWR